MDKIKGIIYLFLKFPALGVREIISARVTFVTATAALQQQRRPRNSVREGLRPHRASTLRQETGGYNAAFDIAATLICTLRG